VPPACSAITGRISAATPTLTPMTYSPFDDEYAARLHCTALLGVTTLRPPPLSPEHATAGPLHSAGTLAMYCGRRFCMTETPFNVSAATTQTLPCYLAHCCGMMFTLCVSVSSHTPACHPLAVLTDNMAQANESSRVVHEPYASARRPK
jgi:hypothetical protein